MAGADVELYTSRFAYGPVARADGYARHEHFYRAALGARGGRARMALKLAQHVPDMLRYRRAARAADVVHFQWLPVQPLDVHLVPSARFAGGGGWGMAWGARARRSAPGERPALVLTAHDVLPREPRRGQLAAQRRLYERFDAIVVHSEHGRGRLVELGVDAARVHVIPHGAFTHLAERAPGRPPPPPPFATDKPVVLFFGLMRPYKGIEVLLEAWRQAGLDRASGDDRDGAADRGGGPQAELWIAGMPRMDISSMQLASPPNVRWDPRFIGDDELPAYFERADLVVLPYLQADQSGVLFTALAFGKPMLLSDVGGFPEMVDTGAARIVPAGDAQALGEALRDLLSDREALASMGRKAADATQGRYSWDSIARAHMELYRSLQDPS